MARHSTAIFEFSLSPSGETFQVLCCLLYCQGNCEADRLCTPGPRVGVGEHWYAVPSRARRCATATAVDMALLRIRDKCLRSSASATVSVADPDACVQWWISAPLAGGLHITMRQSHHDKF